jgi:hypothetical protein
MYRREGGNSCAWRAEPPGDVYRAVRRSGGVEDGRGGDRTGEWLLAASFRYVGGASIRPWLRFPSPLIEPDLQISSIRLSDWFHERLTVGEVTIRRW